MFGHLTDRNIWQLATFAVYIVSIVFFANLYYRLYRSRRGHFSFNKDILNQQTRMVQGQVEAALKNAETQRRLISEALQSFKRQRIKHFDDDDVQFLRLTSGEIYCVRPSESEPPPLGRPPQPSWPEFPTIKFTTQGKDIGERPMMNWDDETLSDIFDDLAAAVDEEIQSTRERLQALATESPDVWYFWDFLYFSTITQTTVGYGDILPNSTKVRLLVMFQMLWGIALVVVVVNLVFSRG